MILFESQTKLNGRRFAFYFSQFNVLKIHDWIYFDVVSCCFLHTFQFIAFICYDIVFKLQSSKIINKFLLIFQLYRQDNNSGRIYVSLASDSTCTSQLVSATNGYESLVLNPRKFLTSVYNWSMILFDELHLNKNCSKHLRHHVEMPTLYNYTDFAVIWQCKLLLKELCQRCPTCGQWVTFSPKQVSVRPKKRPSITWSERKIIR